MRRSLMASLAIVLWASLPALADETPKRGGILTYMIPADAPPSFDGHREATFATIHAVAPFYSVLVRANPNNPADTTDFVCDVCTAVPQPTDDGRTWTFTIRGDVKFTDGAPLTAYDVAASWNHIVHPSAGVVSARQGYMSMVYTIEATEPRTVVFRLKYATSAFLPALADPYAFIYQKKNLERDPHWYEKNISGSGPFRFKEYQTGQSISGERNPDYYRSGLPYLDGFIGIYAEKQASRVAAIRGDRAAIEFRGFPPATRDELKADLGDQITVQESDWNCGNPITPNHKRKPFDDVRVRRALSLAIDRWGGAPAMAKISVMRTVGGVAFPGSPLAATKEELQQLAGWWPDIDKSRDEAKRLLKEAGRRRISASSCSTEMSISPINSMVCGSSTSGARSASRSPSACCKPDLSTMRCASRMSPRWSTATARTSSIRCSTARNTCRTPSQARIMEITRTNRRSRCTTSCCAKPISPSSGR